MEIERWEKLDELIAIDSWSKKYMALGLCELDARLLGERHISTGVGNERVPCAACHPIIAEFEFPDPVGGGWRTNWPWQPRVDFVRKRS